MTLNEYLTNAAPDLRVRIGTDKGSGYVFMGTVSELKKNAEKT